MVYVYLRAPALLAALLLLSPTSSRQSTEGANAVVVQHLFLGGDGLASGDINGTTFETSGLVTLRGVVFAFAAMSCPGRAKHSVTVCGAPLARYGTGAIALRRSADSARTWGPLLFINATVDSLERDVLLVQSLSPTKRQAASSSPGRASSRRHRRSRVAWTS